MTPQQRGPAASRVFPNSGESTSSRSREVILLSSALVGVTSAVQGSVLGFPVQKRYGHTGMSPTKGHDDDDDEGTGEYVT